MTLDLAIKEGKPSLDWSKCSGRFDWYKVVRSTDSTVSWPMGAGDTLAAYVGRDGKTAVWDRGAAAGTTVWYRVFCVRASHGGYKVVNASPTKSIEVPAKTAEPAPDPVALGFEVRATDDGSKLRWEATASKSFVYYKVLRSAGPNPSYLPWTDGTQVIAVITRPGSRSFIDTHVEAGQTWYYRVQAIGTKHGHKFVIGQTTVIAHTVN